MTDEEYMREALVEARKAYDMGEIPIGAVLVHEGKIISRHHNRREIDHDATAHAEVLVIREANAVLERWRLTVEVRHSISPCKLRLFEALFSVFVDQSSACRCAQLLVTPNLVEAHQWGDAQATPGMMPRHAVSAAIVLEQRIALSLLSFQESLTTKDAQKRALLGIPQFFGGNPPVFRKIATF